MSKLKSILFYYNLVFTFVLLLIGFITKIVFESAILLIIFIPLMVYFGGYLIFNSKKIKTPQSQSFWIFVSFLLIYNFFATIILSLSTLIFSKTLPNFIVAFLYFPYPVYFFLTIFHWFKKLKGSRPVIPNTVSTTDTNDNSTAVDPHRRQFLKLIGGTSLSLIFLSLLNPKQAGAAFFGSVPGPGTVSLKDASGVKINPAEKQPTDGYKISQIDNTDYPHYYGYVNLTGAWYVMNEDASGNYRYAKGDENFSLNWDGRSGLTYDYFDSIF